MKILHLVDYYQPQLGYQEPLLAKEHQKLGHEVLVVTCNRYFPFTDYSQSYIRILGPRKLEKGMHKENGINVLRLPVIVEIGTVPIYLGIYKAIQQFNPDILCIHGTYKISTLLGLISQYNRRKIIKVIVDTHEAKFNTNFHRNIITKSYYYFIVKSLIKPMFKKLVNKVIAIGIPEAEMISNILDIDINSIDIVPPGVDSLQFKPDKKVKKTFRKKLGLKESDFVFIYTGKIEERKKLELLINAFNKVQSDLKDIKLIIVGNGVVEYTNKIIELINKTNIKSNIIFIRKMVAHTQLHKYYQISDVGIWAGDVSISRFEALATGLNLIVPNTNLSKDLIDLRCAISFESDNEEQLINSIKYAYSLRYNNNVKVRNRQIALNHYSWKYLAQKFIETKLERG